MSDTAKPITGLQEKNIVRKFGLEMHNPVFFVSTVLILLFAGLTLVFPQKANVMLFGAKDWSLQKFDWFYSACPVLVLAFLIILSLSPLGKIRLGGPDAKPEFSVLSWIGMLFSAGIGIGFMFYGSAEPLAYFTNWDGSPFNVEAGTEVAHRLAITTSIFHWGIFGWAIFAIVGVTLAFFAYNRGLPLAIRSAFYSLLGERIWGWPGHIIDMFAVISTIFGLACTIGIGATQATGGLSYIFDLEATTLLQILLIGVIASLAAGSVLRGLRGGIKPLANINMIMATALLVFVLIYGPTGTIFKSLGTAAINLTPDSLRLANWTGRPDQQFLYDWTIFYWAWWIAWSPFVGLFIARISKGRTIRQFMAGVLIAPQAIAWVWFTAFGETVISQYQNQTGDLAKGMKDPSLVLFQMLDSMPFAGLTSLIVIGLLIIFIVTSADSGALVVDRLTSGGHAGAAAKRQRIFWASMLGLTAIALLYGGGADALKALQAGTITGALPFTAIVILYCVCLTLGLWRDRKEKV